MKHVKTAALVARINAHEGVLTPRHLAEWTGQPWGDAALNDAALAIARACVEGDQDMAEAGAAMDELQALLMRSISDGRVSDARLPSPFWDIFEAFDAGQEAGGAGGGAEVTRAMLAEILASGQGVVTGGS